MSLKSIEVKFKSKKAQREELTQRIIKGVADSMLVTDKRYPLEVVDATGTSTPGNRPGKRTRGHVSSLSDSLAQNLEVQKEALGVRKKIIIKGKEVWVGV